MLLYVHILDSPSYFNSDIVKLHHEVLVFIGGDGDVVSDL
jgi:hypothetical protein